MSYFPQWKLKKDGIIAPDERLPTGQTLALGVQHVVAMFGSTILAPLLMGFDPNLLLSVSLSLQRVTQQDPDLTPTSAWRWVASLPVALFTRW